MKNFSRLVVTLTVYLCVQLSIQDELDLFTNVDAVCRQDNTEVLKQVSTQFEIVGGVTADADRFPYLVSLQQLADADAGKFLHVCGGTLIGPRTILTAAHCILTTYPNGRAVQDLRQNSQDGDRGNIKPNQLYAALNPFCRHQMGKYARVMAQYYVLHPEYQGQSSSGNDIAVLYLEKEFEGFEGPYMDYQSSEDVDLLVDEEFVTMGWGATGIQEVRTAGFVKTVSPLQSTKLDYLDSETCNLITTEVSPSLQIITDQMLCFQGKKFSDTCSGDSGGPLILAIEDEIAVGENFNSSLDIQVGITSWGPDYLCSGVSGFPGVYTFVAQYINWIDSVVEPSLLKLPPLPSPMSSPLPSPLSPLPSPSPFLQSSRSSFDLFSLLGLDYSQTP